MSPGPSAPITLLWGEDDFLLREAAFRILGDLRPTEVDAAEWQGGELQDFATPSLFGERRALLITDARSLSKEATAELVAYLAAPDPDSPLVICCQTAERGKPPVGLERAVKPVGEVRELKIVRKDLEPWLIQRARSKEIDLAPPGARALVETLGEDPAELASALEQLASAFPGEKLTPALVARQFRGLGEQKVWDLCDRMFERDAARAIRSLRSLLEARGEPLMILGSVAARIRELIRVKSLPDRMKPEEARAATGMRFDWQIRRSREQARRFTMAELVAIHARIAQADRELKSGATGDVVLPVVVTEIAARA